MLRRFIPNPLQMETAKASIDSPTPIKNSSTKPTAKFLSS